MAVLDEFPLWRRTLGHDGDPHRVNHPSTLTTNRARGWRYLIGNGGDFRQ